MNLFTTITKAQFLSDYWNKKHYLFKGAAPELIKAMSADDFIEFAQDEELEARVITSDYQVINSPIAKEVFDRPYTLFCHDLNIHHPIFEQLQKQTESFLPAWIFDDVMGSISVAGTSSGAHFDHYGVFLAQGEGTRLWEIQYGPDKTLSASEDLQILQTFDPTISIELNPGDVLYMPPLVAHKATSLTDSIAYSIGTKAYRANEVLRQFLIDSIEAIEVEDFYKYSPGDQVSDFSKQMYQCLKDKLLSPQVFESWCAFYLSSPKTQIEADQYLAKQEYTYNPYTRVVENGEQIYVNGTIWDGEVELIREVFLHKKLPHLTSAQLEKLVNYSVALL